MITLEELDEMFANMAASTNWNLDGKLLWGYFFFDPSDDKLRALASELQEAGYRMVQVYPADDGSTWVLHVERVEHHTSASLFARNEELARLAAERGIASYDGMDVGPAQ